MQTKRLSIPTLTPWKVLLRTALICFLVAVVVFALGLKRIDSLPLSGAPLKFDHKQAHGYMAKLAAGFPNRVTWSDSRRKATAWLKDELRKMGYEPQGMLFSEVIDGKRYTDLENVYVLKPGTEKPDEIIAVMAHYDITDTTVEGAMDDASGVGVVLELARVFANEKTKRSLLFILTDSEEYGAFWGARAFAASYPRANQIVATANFDFVAPHDQTGILTLSDGLKEGFTPLWLREMALDSIENVGGAKALDMTNMMEFIQRALQIPAADHGPFLAKGIPAFNWVGQMDNFAWQMTHFHHTPNDNVAAFSPEPFQPYGRAAERLLRSLDDLNKIPENFRDSSYWKVTSGLYMEGWVSFILHILAFIPFLAFCVSKFGITMRNTAREEILPILANEAKHMGILLGSILLGYALMLLLPALRVVTQYEAFPATQKSILLYTPNFLAMLLVVMAVLGIFWVARRVFREPHDTVESAEIRQTLHAAILSIIIFLAFLKNSYLGVLLLLPPAYLWSFMKARRKKKSRLLNAVLLLGGAITFVAILILMSTIFHVGVVYWYLFLAATYGLISAYSVVLFAMALTVMIRLFRAFVL